MFQDTAGSERYEAMSRIYYRGARAAIVCYDLTDKSSFDRARFWIGELQKHEEVSCFFIIFKLGLNVYLWVCDKSCNSILTYF